MLERETASHSGHVLCFFFFWGGLFVLKQMSSVKDGTAEGKNTPKKVSVMPRAVSASKVKMVPSVLKRGSENKNTCTVKAPSQKGTVPSSSSGKTIFDWNATTLTVS